MNEQISQRESMDLVESLPRISHIHGNIYVGSWPDGEVPAPIKNIIRCCPHRTPYVLGEGQRKVDGYLFDSSEKPDFNHVCELVAAGVAFAEDGPTLIHCKGGLNRSGLIAALVLMQQGYEAAWAVKTLREKRTEHMLNNEVFEQFVLDPHNCVKHGLEQAVKSAVERDGGRVRAKMSCNFIETQEFNKGFKQVKVHLGAVYGTEGENRDFANATPSGACWMQIDAGRPAASWFEPGKKYYMTFTEAPE